VSSSTRLFAAAVAISAAWLGGGLGWEALRFGLSGAGTASRLEREVRHKFDTEARQVESLARRVAAESSVRIAEAAASPDRLPALFDDLAARALSPSGENIALTVYVPDGASGYRVLAWNVTPAPDLPFDRLSGSAALFVARGTGGLRLIDVQPVEKDGRRLAVVAAEDVLASVFDPNADAPMRLDTSFGPVTLLPQYQGGGDSPPRANGFVITSSSGAALLEVRYSPDDVAARRSTFRRVLVATSVLPILAVVLLLTGPALDRRRSTRTLPGWWVATLTAVVLTALGTLGLAGLVAFAGGSPTLTQLLLSLGALTLVALVAGGFWWRRHPRLMAARAPVQFVAEHLAAGTWLAGTIVALAVLLNARITPAALEQWQAPLFPIEVSGLLYLSDVLVTTLALCWLSAAVLAIVAGRWRVSLTRRSSIVAVALWLLPAGLALAFRRWLPPMPWLSAALVLAAAVAFGVAATALRRYYRHTTQGMRLFLLFVALFAPCAVVYPMAASTADRTTRDLIEHEYAPATVRHPEEIRAQLTQAEADIDRIPGLIDLVSSGSPGDSQAAFRVWSRTSLSRTRVTADVELYGPDRQLVSRFALNLPEYLYRTSTQTWTGTACAWDMFGEVTRFGAEDRRMLHAERGLCDGNGRVRGAVVVHAAYTDYDALPFVSSVNPYYEVLGIVPNESPRLPDLEVVVYGWSLQPLYRTGNVAWPIAEDLFKRLYDTGKPFWTSLPADNRIYQVFFSQDRNGIYALAYPVPTPFQHATRLAEVAALMAVLFVLLQLGAAIYAPMARHRQAPLRALFHEIRTSFYRKLFLFFVLAAVVPVLLFALAFGAYMTTKFRDDVESEATSVVTVAKRVYEELAAAQQHPDATPVLPTDDAMVAIRQVIDQDVNLFYGPRLVATSQRDLFDSNLLPMRTPASIYRSVVLERLPTFVTQDRLGSFEYLLAAAPVTLPDRQAVLVVPLANRQREIEREVDDLNRGVLVGATLVILFAAGLGASVAGRVSDPVSRLTRATRLIAAGRLDVRITADTADELRRLVDDFNSMTETLVAQRAALARTNQLKAWNEMARQVAHEIKNPLTPIQLATEHLQRVHDDRGQPLGSVFAQCVSTILGQVRLLRQIASEFSNFAGEPQSRPEAVALPALLASLVEPYRLGLAGRITLRVDAPEDLPAILADRTLLSRALTNLIENAIQAMPGRGELAIAATRDDDRVRMTVADTGVGMDEATAARAFEPYFSTKTGGSGLGLANARRNIEMSGGTVELSSTPGVGTRITITLPVAAPPAASAGAPAPAR
jgi:signal transduction histidine kinase